MAGLDDILQAPTWEGRIEGMREDFRQRALQLEETVRDPSVLRQAYEDLIAIYMSNIAPVPLKTRITPDPGFEEFFTRVQAKAMRAQPPRPVSSYDHIGPVSL